jgi:arginyl-tRNA synthetase
VELSRTVQCAVRRAVDQGELRVRVPERVVVGPPGPGGCGDYATNVALQLARPAGQPARRVADLLRRHLAGCDGIRDVVVTGPGFLNFALRQDDADAGAVRVVEEILARGMRYGYVEASGMGQGVRLHCRCELRAVVVTDVVARLLRSQGAVVRSRCDRAVPAEWETVLGVRFEDGAGDVGCGAGDDVHVRPVPVTVGSGDPLELGRDACRWALLQPAGHDQVRISRDHLVQRESNPLFRVRYAHARTRALRRNAADLGFGPQPGPTALDADGARSLLGVLADHPRVLAQAAAHRAPDRVARHLVAVADGVLPLLPTVLPLGQEKPSAAHRARLALAEAAGTVLAGGLSLLGIDAPDHL